MGATLRRWTWSPYPGSLLDADDGRGEHGAALGDFPEERIDLRRERLDIAARLDGDMVMGSDSNNGTLSELCFQDASGFRVGSYTLNSRETLISS